MTLKEMQEKVKHWVNKLPPDITVKWLADDWYTNNGNPHSDYDHSRIYYLEIPKPITEFDFAVTMHELGHLFDTSNGKKPFIYGGTNEIEAWKWAHEQIGPMTQEMLRAVREGMDSYDSTNAYISSMVFGDHKYINPEKVHQLYKELGVEDAEN